MPARTDTHPHPREAPPRQWMRRALQTVAAGVTFVVAFGGLLHTPVGRPLLVRLFGGCPAMAATPTQMDAARRMGSAADKGSERAPTRPVFEFSLEQTSAQDVLQWAKTHHVACREDHEWLIQCDHVPAAALGRPAGEGSVDELAIGLSAQHRVINVTTMRSHLSSAEGSLILRSIASNLSQQLGPSHTLEPSNQLSDEPLSSTRVSAQYADYLAEVTALNIPGSGVTLREHYLSPN